LEEDVAMRGKDYQQSGMLSYSAEQRMNVAAVARSNAPMKSA
jgi:hypothetical protein